MKNKGLVNLRFEGPPWFLVDSSTTYVEPGTGYLNEGAADFVCNKYEGVRAVFLFTTRDAASMVGSTLAEKIPGAKFVPARPREAKHCIGFLESAQASGNTHVIIDHLGSDDEEVHLGLISELVAQMKTIFKC